MTLRQYLFFMSLGTGLCWLAWIFIILNIDPKQAGLAGFALFYLSLFLSLLGSISIAGFWIRKKIFRNDDIVFRHVKKTFRQGIMLALAIILALGLQQADKLCWWVPIVLIILIYLLEVLVFANRRHSNQDYV